MKILFLTGLYPYNCIPKLNELSNGHIQNASNVFQWAVVDGLHKNNVDYEVISFPFLPSYPLKYKDLFTPSSKILFHGNEIGRMISYCDLIAYKTYSIQRHCEKEIRKWLERNKGYDDKLVILTYTPYAPFLQTIKSIKHDYPNIIVSSIVTDLVDNMMEFKSNRSFFKRIQCIIEKRNTKALYKYIDKFILLSSPMAEKIPEAKNKYIVIEGISVHKEYVNSNHIDDKQSILYTGTLEDFSGVGYLIRAFRKISNPNVRLIICGSGNLEMLVKEAAKEDTRIIFKGIVTREEAVELQGKVTLLINPRRPDGEITRFSFPSKTMEYLSSGTPMIGYKLEGIPTEYYNYYYTIDDLSEDSLINTIEYVLSLPISELKAKARSAYDFIINYKSSQVQVKKIIDYLSV